MEWAGMKTESDGRDSESSLWMLNDNYRWDFNQIAEVIREDWEIL